MRSEDYFGRMAERSGVDFKVLAENSVDIICLVGLDLVMHYASPSCLPMLGWTPEEMCDKGPEAFVFPDDLPIVAAAHNLLMVHGVDITPSTIRMRRKDGFFAWVEVNARIMKDQQTGDATGIVLTMRDITDRIEGKKKIQDLNERLELAINAGGIGIWEVDLVSGQYLLDSRMHEIYGVGEGAYRADVPVNTFGGSFEEWLAVVYPEDIPKVKQVAQKLWAGTPFINYEHRIVKASGEIRYVRSSGQTFRDANGVPVRIVGTTQDVSAERESAAALQEAEKLAAVGRLASSVAHEINNPLQSVTNLLYVAEGATRRDERHSFIEQAQEELARVSHVVTQTLRFHHQSEKPVSTQLGELTRSVLTLFRSRLDRAAVSVEVDDRQAADLLCYRSDIRQVLANVISNAVDAVDGSDGARILVRIRDKADPETGKNGVWLVVADNGPGMDPETQKRLFEPFFSTKGARAAGLGLWVCKEILNRHKASVHLKSSTRAHCQGTVVAFFLPLDAGIGSPASV